MSKGSSIVTQLPSPTTITDDDDDDDDGAIVIITGGCGFLGQCLAVELIKNYQTILKYNTSNNNDTNNDSTTIVVPIQKIILADVYFPVNNDSNSNSTNDDTTKLQTDRLIESIQQEQKNNTTTNGNITRGHPQIIKKQGDISSKEYCTSLLAECYNNSDDDDNNYNNTKPSKRNQYISVFHLGGVMSGDGERDYDLAFNVNLIGCINLLESCRLYKTNNTSNKKQKCIVNFIFASAGATMSSPNDPKQSLTDMTRAVPQTTYGMTKACCELICNDYVRRQFINHYIGLRFPTVIIRPGLPNAALTGAYSSIVRDTIASSTSTPSTTTTAPVSISIDPTIPHAVTSTRTAITSMIIAHNVSPTVLNTVFKTNPDRTIFVPSITVTIQQLYDTLCTIVEPVNNNDNNDDTIKDTIRTVIYNIDETISNIVRSFPINIDSTRAIQLGISPPQSIEQIIRDYIQDFSYTITDKIQLKPIPVPISIELKQQQEEKISEATPTPTTTTATLSPQQQQQQELNVHVPDRVTINNNKNKRSKIAVITGGGSGIGQAVAVRLATDTTQNWCVVVCGRYIDRLLETQAIIEKSLFGNSTTNTTTSTTTIKDKCLCVVADVSKEQDVQVLFTTIRTTFGTPITTNNNTNNTNIEYYCPIDLLFNNAGCNPPSCVGPIETVPLNEFNLVLQTNVVGPFLCTREAIRCHLHAIQHIEEKQQQQQQQTDCFLRIINNGSISAHTPRPLSVCYTTSKHAVLGLTKVIALDGRSIGVTCGQIDFGNVTTSLSSGTNNTTIGGALQPNGTRLVEPTVSIKDAANTVATMANLPPEANMLYVSVIATTMPFVGRG